MSMRGAVLQSGYLYKFVTEDCNICDAVYGLEQNFKEKRVKDGKTFYCPNGHATHYTQGKTEEQKLREQLDAERRAKESEIKKREWAEQEARVESRARVRAENKLKRVNKRVQNGVCPCCKRTFENLARHMATKHPEQKQ